MKQWLPQHMLVRGELSGKTMTATDKCGSGDLWQTWRFRGQVWLYCNIISSMAADRISIFNRSKSCWSSAEQIRMTYKVVPGRPKFLPNLIYNIVVPLFTSSPDLKCLKVRWAVLALFCIIYLFIFYYLVLGIRYSVLFIYLYVLSILKAMAFSVQPASQTDLRTSWSWPGGVLLSTWGCNLWV